MEETGGKPGNRGRDSQASLQMKNVHGHPRGTGWFSFFSSDLRWEGKGGRSSPGWGREADTLHPAGP